MNNLPFLKMTDKDRKIMLSVTTGFEYCVNCNGTGKVILSSKYDDSDKTNLCQNILKHIERVINGCPCNICDGTGLIQILTSNQINDMIATKAKFEDKIYESMVIPESMLGQPILAKDAKLGYLRHVEDFYT